MKDRILICTDLDRTLVPNGPEPESPNARDYLAALMNHSDITLCYVSGRHKELVEKAIVNYALPYPDFVIGDVGTTIYNLPKRAAADSWEAWSDWGQEIAPDWVGLTNTDLRLLFNDISALRMQEMAKQNRFKLSYYVSIKENRARLIEMIRERLNAKNIKASLIWSIDEPAGVGLLDILPASATKYHAIEFLMKKFGFTLENTVFAGDSGNDMEVLVSPIHSVLVANSASYIKTQAQQLASEMGTKDALYIAAGGFMGMNGNYSAGILEGVAHYLPQTATWLDNEGIKK